MKSKLNNNPDITIDDNNPAKVQYANRYLEFFSIFTTISYVLMKFKFARVYTLIGVRNSNLFTTTVTLYLFLPLIIVLVYISSVEILL
jgi:hypothetical protein